MKTRICYLLIILLLAACSNQSPNIKQYYRLNADVPSLKTGHENKRPSVLITRPKTLSILGGRPMVATKEDGALVQLNYHYWLESPTILLQHTLKNWATHHWQNIKTTAAYNERLDRLDSTIMAFEKHENQAKVSIQFVLHNADGETLLDKTWKQEITMDGDGYAYFVKATNLAVTHILENLSKSIQQL